MIKVVVATMLASIILSDMANAASLIEGFVGRWSGHGIETPNDAIPAETISIRIDKHGGGFELSWNDLALNDQGVPAAEPLEARFVATDREGVFEFSPKSDSFLDRMFASTENGNPLEGETLLWARIDAATLAVYSLTINENGGFDLDHYSWTKTDGGLALAYRTRTQEVGAEVLLEGHLVPAGG